MTLTSLRRGLATMPAELETALQQLRDLHLPPAPGDWPPAPGEWGLALLAMALLAGGVWLLRRRVQGRYRRQARAELQAAYAHWQTYGNTAGYLQAVNVLLCRAILQCRPDHRGAADPPDSVASTSGDAWVAALNARLDPPLASDAANALAVACYQPDPQVDVAQLDREVRRWIDRHRPVPQPEAPHANRA
ncbi:MAG: DUF4381 domain-containing protein [Cellvibrionales bacterium]|nr:DUF4381 domain-containing protein [Cellvibrionales bacterium]